MSGRASWASDLPKEVVRPKVRAGAPYLLVKRGFDIVASLAALALLSGPMLLIALLVRLDSPGPALFRQERLGKDGRPFMMVKFRSMDLDAEKDGPQWAEKDDERCTRVGRVLRNSRLDELPQLWNILVGDMSFVGPRPERAYFYEEFEKTVPGFSVRLMVTPGLTGLAQISGGYDLTPAEKIVFDVQYMENRSLALDAMCILKTVSLVFTHAGAR